MKKPGNPTITLGFKKVFFCHYRNREKTGSLGGFCFVLFCFVLYFVPTHDTFLLMFLIAIDVSHKIVGRSGGFFFSL